MSQAPLPPQTPPPAQPPREPLQTSTLGRASLFLGIASSALVFGIGFCAVTLLGTPALLQASAIPLYVCGASSGFLGLIGALVGTGALFARNTERTSAIVGIVLGLLGICLFITTLAIVGG